MKDIWRIAPVLSWSLLLPLGCGNGNGGETQDGGTADCVVLPDHFDQNTTLPKACYLAHQTPVMASGVTLTLAPGVKIIFDQNIGLEFSTDTALVASGTAADPILLTGAQAENGFWEGLIFDTVQSSANRLDYVTVEYAGSTTAANDPDAAAVKAISDSGGVHLSMTHCNLRESQGWGLYLSGFAVVDEFASNTITANTLGAASVGSEVASVLDAASSYHGNTVDQVLVRTNLIGQAATWASIDVPYVLDGALNVDAVWTLSPGVNLVLDQDAWIFVGDDASAMNAVGTAAAPITITGAQKTSGYWDTIQFDNTNNAANVFDHVVVEYGGSTANSGDFAEVAATSDSHGVTLTVRNSTFRHSPLCGLYLGTYATATIDSSNQYEDLAGGNVCQQP